MVRTTRIAVCLSALVLVLWADQATAGERLGRHLRRLRDTRVTTRNLAEASRSGFLTLSMMKGRPFVRSLIVASPGAERGLRHHGVQNLRRHGPVFTADVPLDALDRLSRLDAITYMRASYRLRPHLELSVPTLPSGSVGLEVARSIVMDSGYQTFPPPYGSTSGSGVVVGVVDTGIDSDHADFSNTDGTTRIKYLWDQNTGTTWTQAQINAGSCTHQDTNGHGTHVAGTAAGNGRATGNGYPARRYVGVAPEADIIGVATTFSDADILDGVSFIFEEAEDLGLPAVVNMSLGGHTGPHDGTDPFDVALDAMTGPGQIVVVSAGNEGDMQIHYRGNWSGSDVNLRWQHHSSPPSSRYSGHIYFVVWHDGLDSYRIRVQSPRSGDYTWAVGETSVQSFDSPWTSVQVENPGYSETEYNGKKQIWIYVWPYSYSGTWNIWLIGDSVSSSDPDQIDAWIFLDQTYLTEFTNGDTDYTVGTPGTGKRMVTVAATTTRKYWTSTNGSDYSYSSGETVETISTFSSRGPSIDGRQKPDITGPGSAIGAALSADSSPNVAFILQDDVHTIKHGTSMSAPHITGLVALMLMQNGTYGPAAIKSILAYRADRDGYVGSAPNTRWGYGKAEATDTLSQVASDVPRASTAGQQPSSGAPGNTLVATATGFVPQGGGSPERYTYQWQKHNGSHYENIDAATYGRLEPQLFSAGDLIRAVVTPYEQISESGNYEGLLLGASRVAAQSIGSSSSYRSHTGSEGWCMVCIPTQDDTAILSDFTEPLYEWDEIGQTYAEAVAVTRGRGYWVEVLPGEGTMHSDGSGAPAGDFDTGLLTYTTDPFRKPGRHLAGNPFNKPIYWENIYVSTTPGSFSLRVTDPGASALIHNVYYAAYDNNGQAYSYYDPADFEERDGKIFPWEAFWILAKQPIYLRIPTQQDAPGTTIDPGPYPMFPRAQTAFGRGPAYTPPQEPVAALPRETLESWRLKLSACAGELRDDYNYIGIHARGHNDYDRLDIPDAGSLSSQRRIQLFLPHDDWGDLSDRYCVDIHGTKEAAPAPRPSPWIARPVRVPRHEVASTRSAWDHRWDLLLESTGIDEPVTVFWRQAPAGWVLMLVDLTDNQPVDMRREHSYTYSPAEESETRSFVVLARQLD